MQLKGEGNTQSLISTQVDHISYFNISGDGGKLTFLNPSPQLITYDFPWSHSGARVPGNEATPTYIEVSLQAYIDIKDGEVIHYTQQKQIGSLELRLIHMLV